MTDKIKYIGVDDAELDLFESQYPLSHGVSYNSYVILDEKIAVFDTIDARCTDEWFYRLEKVLDGRQPDYLIIHHMEPDHSSNIAEAMSRYPDMKLVATGKAISMIPQFFENVDFSGRTMAVKDGDKLSLGERELTFMTAPMIHWPEVMVTYDKTDGVLFTADAFGKFGVLSYKDDWINEARRYYINIVGKYGAQTQSLLKKCASLDIKAIAPLHGPVLEGDLSKYVALYDKWSSYTPECDGVLIAYASVYGGTAEAAVRLGDMLRERGVEVVLHDLCRQDISEAVAQAFRMSHMVLASVTYDAGLFPPMSEFLHHLKNKNYQKRTVGLIQNGSWAPVAAKLMRESLEGLKNVEIVEPVVTITSRMKTADIPNLEALADAIHKNS